VCPVPAFSAIGTRSTRRKWFPFIPPLTNSSGKSNFFDALRVLQAIGYGLRVDEIFNGKPKSGNSDVWEPIRGGSANAGLLKWDPGRQALVRHTVAIAIGGGTVEGDFRYWISLAPAQGKVLGEHLAIGGVPVFDVRESKNTDGHFDRDVPMLSQHPGCSALRDLLADCQGMDPAASVLREYSLGREVRRMGEHGENFAALVKTILEDEATATAYRSWLERLTPKDLDDVAILHGALTSLCLPLSTGARFSPLRSCRTGLFGLPH
jgi:hypothetical protein